MPFSFLKRLDGECPPSLSAHADLELYTRSTTLFSHVISLSSHPSYLPMTALEAQQRYFSYRVMLATIVSQISFPREGFCRNSRGIFLNKVLGQFCRRFFVDFCSGLFPWKKTGGKKNPPKNPRQNSHQKLGASRPNSTLQGSGLDSFMLVFDGISHNYRATCSKWGYRTDAPA